MIAQNNFQSHNIDASCSTKLPFGIVFVPNGERPSLQSSFRLNSQFLPSSLSESINKKEIKLNNAARANIAVLTIFTMRE